MLRLLMMDQVAQLPHIYGLPACPAHIEVNGLRL